MKKREYAIFYKIKDQDIEDLFNTLELIIFLIYTFLNKKIEIKSIHEYTFVE